MDDKLTHEKNRAVLMDVAKVILKHEISVFDLLISIGFSEELAACQNDYETGMLEGTVMGLARNHE